MSVPKVRGIVLAVATLALVASAFAQPGNALTSKHFQGLVMENFRQSLRSDYQGVVEWTILDVVVYKSKYPDLNYDGILDRLNRLAESNKVPSVSYKAYLAGMYLTHPEKIEIVESHNIETEEGIFRQIAQQLEKNLLSSNIEGGTVTTR
jgi:hypothetical protein